MLNEIIEIMLSYEKWKEKCTEEIMLIKINNAFWIHFFQSFLFVLGIWICESAVRGTESELKFDFFTGILRGPKNYLTSP
jgi:hypothetical protein